MKRFTRFVLIFFIVMFIIISILIVCSAFVLHSHSSSKVEPEMIEAISSYGETKFYCVERMGGSARDNTKEIIGASLTKGGKFDYAEYNTIPNDLKNAFISIEDKRYFDHNGIDYRRSLSAAVNLIFTGNASFGGSTITQQLVKNLTGNDQKNINRKLSEAFCAMDLERYHDKTEILEMYLNIINLAHGCRGVGAASKYYFSKSVSDLSLCECAALAAITNNPSKYDPKKNPENNKKRRNTVLKCMHEQGYISEDEYKNALAEELILKVSSDQCNKINSWYIDTVIEDVIADYAKKYNISKQNASVLLYRGGYKIYTAMDEKIQMIVDDYFNDTNNFPKDSNGENPLSSMIIIDPNSGDVLAIAGNIGEKRGNRIQNYATDTKRPPGSTIKPLSVYTPALEKGLIEWSSIFEDSPIEINKKNGRSWPANANGKYVGDVTIKHAVANSLNTIAVKVLKIVGNKESFDFLQNELNISSLDQRYDMGDASLALGQPTRGLTLRELTSAYSIFQSGIMCSSRTYYKVTDRNGRVILDNSPKQNRVISEETASIMTKLLQTVITEGTASHYITLDNIEVAGKTGTTQFGYDKYFVGYTPQLLAGVWQGYEIPKTVDCYQGNYAVCIWDDIMNLIYNERSGPQVQGSFKISGNVQQYSYNKNTGKPFDLFDDPSDIEYGWFDIKDKKIP